MYDFLKSLGSDFSSDNDVSVTVAVEVLPWRRAVRLHHFPGSPVGRGGPSCLPPDTVRGRLRAQPGLRSQGPQTGEWLQQGSVLTQEVGSIHLPLSGFLQVLCRASVLALLLLFLFQSAALTFLFFLLYFLTFGRLFGQIFILFIWSLCVTL